MAINIRSEEYGVLQEVIDEVFCRTKVAHRLDIILVAETFDVVEDIREIIELLPPGPLYRQDMCDQLNSALAAHGWGRVYGTVE